MKKLVSLFLAALLLITGTAALAETPGFHAEGMPIVDEPISLKVLTMRWSDMGDSFADNAFLVNLEQETNVHIDWQIVSSNDWFDQKAIILAGGESVLPDVVVGNQTFNNQDYMRNTEYFVPLEDLIEQYMPNLTKAFEEMPALKARCTYPDGHIWSLPARMPKRPAVNQLPVINMKWLDNLGLEVPNTLDELEAVLIAFKEQDANGNGDPNDEIPITAIWKSGDPTAAGQGIDFWVPFGINENLGYMINEDGSASFVFATEQYKAGLKWLHKLYEEGVIDQEVFTQDQPIRDAKCDDPEVSRVGFVYAWSPEALFKRWAKEYAAITPLIGPDGRRYANGDKNGVGAISGDQLAITTVCKYPEVVLRWADQFYTGEASIQNFWGALGEVTCDNGDGTYSLNSPPDGVSSDAWYWDRSLRDFGPKYSSLEFDSKIILDPNEGDGFKVALDGDNAQYVLDRYPDVMFTAEELDELVFLKTDIFSLVNTKRAKWITEGGIDKEWDDYVSKLYELGLEDMDQFYQNAYAKYLESLK